MLLQLRESAKGQGSFCVPRTAIQALLDNKATAYEICTYLVLAKHTDASGLYSTASVKAVNKATGANKTRGGPVDRAIARLMKIRVLEAVNSPSGGRARSQTSPAQATDRGPILIDRATWVQDTGELLPDGPTERGKVRFILPGFDEDPLERVWISSNLVAGIGAMTQPLKALKNAGDVAARLLLSMYAANDMENWGGVRPVGEGCGPWKHYEPVAESSDLKGNCRLLRAKDSGKIVSLDQRINGGDVVAFWQALEALESIGLIYEVVMVLNRAAKPAKFSNGAEYGAIPDDAEPYYELDVRSRHGYKPDGEEGLGGATATTARDLGEPVANRNGVLDGTYAAIVPAGFSAMIAGIYRLRFRVANSKNVGVSGAWARIRQNNRDALGLVERARKANNLLALAAPGSQARQPPRAQA